LRPKEDVVTDFYDVALVLNSDLQDLRKAGKVNVQQGAIKQYNVDGTVALADGSTLKSDVVVCATGFAQDYSIFTDPGTARDLEIHEDGMYLYRYILPEKVANLAFIGHTAAISNISSYGLQAEWLARKFAGKLVPSVQEASPVDMHNEIEARKKWARSWMPETSSRGMNVLLHQTHYHDLLLRDMGISPLRKSNPLSEYLMPYEPSDYNGIMAGSSAAKQSGKNPMARRPKLSN
jgi:Flavin-binding monooxygenase-like